MSSIRLLHKCMNYDVSESPIASIIVRCGIAKVVGCAIEILEISLQKKEKKSD